MPVKFTATVARSASGATGKPSGNVTFSYAGITLGTSAIGSNGQASLTLPTNGLEAGNYAITATYSGDAGDAVSTSKAQTVTVQ
jgi:azurin